MNIPSITIVIPTFNSANSLRACLDSVVGQTQRPKEVFLMDGLSTDATKEIAREYGEKYSWIKLISEKDNGIYDAINKGIRLAEGEWVYVLGSDDRLFEPETLEKATVFLNKSGEGIIYGNVMVKGDAGWAKDGQVHDGEFPLEKLLQQNICQQAVFYRRTLFKQIGYFNNEYHICADWDFMLRSFAGSSVKYIDLIIAEFNGGGASTTKKEEKFYEDFARNMYAYFGFRVFKKEFKSVAWRFKKYAETEAAKGNRISAAFYKLVSNRLNNK